jgi:hypothetical protein
MNPEGGYVGLNVGADWGHDGFNSQGTPGPCTAIACRLAHRSLREAG